MNVANNNDFHNMNNIAINAFNNELEKIARIGGLIGKAIGLVKKAPIEKELSIGKRLSTWAKSGRKDLSFGQKVIRGVAGGGAMYGAYKGGQYTYRRATEPGHSVYIRNQIRHGRINPSQVNPKDLSKAFHKPIPEQSAY